jgi:hypothetical protein
MSARQWDGFLTPADQKLVGSLEPRPRRGLGDRAAVVLVDEPAAGAVPQHVADQIAALTTAAHAAGAPVFRSTCGAAAAHETVLDASSPSAFFGTPLIALLTAGRIDTVIVCGATVSGRVRATVVDAFSYRLHVVVVEGCVFDPYESAAALSLFDIDRSYADVVSSAEVIGELRRRGHGHDHGHEREHKHGHHDHRGGHREGAPGVAALPALVLAALPPDAVPRATIHHPIHGHVLAKAGDSVVAAATDAIARSFGATPHVVVALRDHEVDEQPDLRRAMAQTEGGVLLVGVAFDRVQQEAPRTAPSHPSAPQRTHQVDPDETCPECGARSARVEPAPPDASGREVMLHVCDDCGAAWDA